MGCDDLKKVVTNVNLPRTRPLKVEISAELENGTVITKTKVYLPFTRDEPVEDIVSKMREAITEAAKGIAGAPVGVLESATAWAIGTDEKITADRGQAAKNG